jgi:hypothetical protein
MIDITRLIKGESNRIKAIVRIPLTPRQVVTRVQAKCLKKYLQFFEGNRQVAVYHLLKQKTRLTDALTQIEPELFPDPSVLNTGEPEQALPNGIFPPVAGRQVTPAFYNQYGCSEGSPLFCHSLRCDLPDGVLRSLQQADCSICGFPAPLVEKVEIRSERGGYKLKESLGQRGFGRLYRAVHNDTQQPIVIKEYLLPSRYFNRAEQMNRQKTLTHFAGLSLVGSPGQDFQILSPIDVLATGMDERCYVIFDARSANPTLNQLLKQTGAWSPEQVYRLLNQLLQILEVLHCQKFQLPMGQVYSDLTHGNLSLDTILIQQSDPNRLDEPFFVYLCDLVLWDSVCRTPLMQLPEPSIAQELRNVGYLAFYALQGGAVARNGQAFDPLEPTHWKPMSGPLKTLVRRLVGLEEAFPSALEARQALLQIPLAALPAVRDYPEPIVEAKRRNWGKIVAMGIVGLVMGAVIFEALKPKPGVLATKIPVLEKIKDIAPLPLGEFRYTAVQNGTWHYLLQTASLIESGQTLEGKLKASQPALALKFEPTSSLEAAFNEVRSGKAAFTIAPLTQPLPEDLDGQTIAYDGLAVFVPFSYANREQGLPNALQGTIAWDQLQKIYRGEVQNWNAFTKSTLPLKPYQAENAEFSAVFEQKVLGVTNPADSPLKSVTRSSNFFELLRSVLRDFESNQTGSIGFAPWSRVVGQCSVYPLAIQGNGQPKPTTLGLSIPSWMPMQNTPASQPLIWQDGAEITPMSNLCDRKGSYRLNHQALKSGQYPLSYPIAVIYAKRNDRPIAGVKFAEMLRTKEGQRLLEQVGLVPAIGE